MAGVGWPFFEHRTLAQVDADAELANATLALIPDAVPADGLKQRVIALHRTFPDWGATRIAQAIGRNDAYVRHVARLNGITLPRSQWGAVPSAGRDYMRAKRAASPSS